MDISQNRNKHLKLLKELHEYSFELSEKEYPEMFDFIVAKARDIFSVKACWISTYDPDSSELLIQRASLTGSEISIINNILKKNIVGSTLKFTADQYEKMLTEKISPPLSLKQVVLGSIPETLCDIVQKTLGFGWFIGISLVNHGKLFGNIFFAGHRDQEPLEEEELLIFRAITSTAMAKKETEKNLIKIKEAAESANKAKSDFLSNMTHELRTPLCGIIGFTDLLETETTLNETQIEFVQMLKSSAKTLLDLVNDTLDLSKIEAGKLELRPQETDISALFNEVFKTFEPLAREKGIQASLIISEKIPGRIFIDPLRLKQILLNLTGNAIKFTNSGFVNLKLEYSAERKSVPFLQVSVEDSGIGIEQQKLHRVTENFYQADSSITRKFGGTGLGLAITDKLLRKMNSSLEISSTPQKGSTFSFKIPLSDK
ncbi:MAG TPA: ATP-binding protein [bacterium]|nr:ATP-binding protein [bacterium]